jgi:hypothetical protein
METHWIAFSYTVPAKKKSSTRVTLWRRLRQLGAVSPTSGIYILPATDDCVESLQWLAQEVEHGGGQAILMHVNHFEGMSETAVIALFQEARKEEYATINQAAKTLEMEVASASSPEAVTKAKYELAKLKRKYAQSMRIDYFHSYESEITAARLERLAQRLMPASQPAPAIATVSPDAFRGKRWVTRPRPHVDRLASAWLIRRFIDDQAAIRYSPAANAGDIAFDMNDADFSHHGDLCTFETMIRAFQIEAKGIQTLAEIVHEIDLRDERFIHPEAIGVDAILHGWLLENLTDAELEQRGLALFDGLFQIISART